MQKVSTTTGIIIVIAAAIVLFGGVFAWQYFAKPQTPMINVQSNQNAQNQPQVKDEISDWKTYVNTQYGFEVKYPQAWFYQEFSMSSKNVSGIGFCPSDGYAQTNCVVVPMMNTPFAPIFINTAMRPVTSSSLHL